MKPPVDPTDDPQPDRLLAGENSWGYYSNRSVGDKGPLLVGYRRRKPGTPDQTWIVVITADGRTTYGTVKHPPHSEAVYLPDRRGNSLWQKRITPAPGWDNAPNYLKPILLPQSP